jgi:AcrR family transcriptional regulator
LGERQAAADKNRARILRAARELLIAKGGTGRFSLEAVARRAGVARMTVYYQFGSRRGLLEALFDSFAEQGALPTQLAAAFQQPDPDRVLAEAVAALARFWTSGRSWIRRVRALGVLDRELGEAMDARNARRRKLVRAVLDRLEPLGPGPDADRRRRELENVLFAVTGFEMFDTLAGENPDLESVAPVVLRLAQAAIEDYRAR